MAQRRLELDRQVIADARLEAVEDHVLGRTLDGEDEGEAEALLVTDIEIGEAGEFVGGEGVQACACLFLARVICELCLGGEIGVRADKVQLRIVVGGADGRE